MGPRQLKHSLALSFALAVLAAVVVDTIDRQLWHLLFGVVLLAFMHPILVWFTREGMAEEVSRRARQITKEEEDD
jgi:membrane-bound metal-dependent hydrolase YbcI (DUF457 family)